MELPFKKYKEIKWFIWHFYIRYIYFDDMFSL